jgi:cell wall-associated NlpC family hydrolase
MPTRADVVRAALSMVGTPYHEQGRVPGEGLDCGGVPICVAHELGLTDFDIRGYGRAPDPERMRGLLAEHMDPVPLPAIAEGDVVAFAYQRGAQQHLGIVTSSDPLRMVHAIQQHGVQQQSIVGAWRRRLRTAYRFRGLAQ